MNKYIVHIPHSGVKIPQKYIYDYYLSTEELHNNIYEYADYLTDELFRSFVHEFDNIVNPYSRLFFDPERFFDDKKEQMQVKYGLGWFYENAILGKKPLRSLKHKGEISKYYDEHHKKLLSIVEKWLNYNGSCTIIDCHSFSNELYWFQDKGLKLPDICIGFDEFHKDEYIIETFLDEFKDYTIAINTPYSGSLVPEKYYMKDKRVKSVMIEINKKIYLEEDNKTKSENFNNISKKLVNIKRKIRNY